MREKILMDQGWRYLPESAGIPVAKTKAGMYISAKTERLKWGPGCRTHIDTPEYWSFESELPPERWEAVDLPHDYIICQTPDRAETGALGFFHYHCAWYRKHFTLSPGDRGKRLTLYFEGITGIADVYLNGCFLKHHNGSYSPFEADISDLADFERENVIAVRVDPSGFDGWWYGGGGIYQHVWLIKTDPVAIDLHGIYVPARKTDGDRWKLPVEIDCRNAFYTPVEAELLCELLDPAGNPVTHFRTAGTLEPRTATRLYACGETVSPQLWDIGTPQLYTLRVTVARKTETGFLECDRSEQRFGFRKIAFSAEEGFFLNDRPVKIKGVCMHLDFGLTGKAVPDNICRYKVRLCREMGANAIRMAHYPHQEATMDACDELGMLVMSENRRFESNPDTLEEMATLVRRDRNRPSVIFWSTGNEEMDYHCKEQGFRIHRALEYEIRRHDRTRPVLSAMTNLNEAKVYEICDIIAANYSFRYLDEIHGKFPKKPFLSSENSANGTMRGHYFGTDCANGFIDARDCDPAPDGFQVFNRANTWKYIMERPWLMGGFQWAAIEHRGEAVWPRLCSVSGALDLFLQKKEAFYQNRSHWLETPVIRLLPHWNFRGMEGMPVSVWCYTNCEEAELFLNGKSLGRKAVEKYMPVIWDVPFAPGKLEVSGYTRNGLACTDCRETTGPAAALRLVEETPVCRANGADMALFSCIAVDAQGREVPDAEMKIRFHAQNGKIIGTGSSITDHVPVTSPVRRMFAGRISIAVLPDRNTPDFRLTAHAETGLNGWINAVTQTENKESF